MELKNGETFNGTMSQCDSWMNVHLREVICTSKEGDRFWRMREAFIRGNTIKYIRVPDDILGKVTEEKFDRNGARVGAKGRGWGEVTEDVQFTRRHPLAVLQRAACTG